MAPSQDTKKSGIDKPLKKLYGTSFLEEYGRVETSRSTRFNSVYSLLFIDPAGVELGAQSEKSNYTAQSKTAKKFISIVLRSLRDCDIVALGNNRLVALLPQTDYFGAFVLIRKIKRSMEQFLTSTDVSVLYSHATFGIDGRSYSQLFKSAQKRAKEQKRSLWSGLDLESKLFWESTGILFREKCSGIYNSNFDTGKGYELDKLFIDQVNGLIINDIKRSPRRRGILIFSTGRELKELPLAKALDKMGINRTKVFLAGEQGDEEVDVGNCLPVFLDDPRLKETYFTFFLNEDFGYAFITRENWGEVYSCFHSSDTYLVEGLINKFQREYSLQEQL